MFGIGFTEIMLISIIAILFLGPDKLPGALVEMGKFIKSVKKTVSEAKSSLEEEMKISDLKEEALNYKKQLTDATDELKGFKNLSFDDEDDVTYDEEISEDSPMAHVASATKRKTPKETDEAEEAGKTEESPKDITTQVEAKNDTVTFEKKPKAKKIAQKSKTKDTSTKKEKKNDNKDNA